MIKYNLIKNFLLVLITFLSFETASACSMYKITSNGKTMLGNNEDSWGRDPKVWFIPATLDKFGVVCVGYARKQPNPDGAMNEHGLAFDAFTMLRKGNLPDKEPTKKDFAYSHILKIMQVCKNVDEVYAFLDTLNLHILDGSPIFNGGMFLFADKTGKYLVVEANKMTLGNNEKFALANFSYADTKDLSTIKTERYCKGIAFLNNKKIETNLSFCSALSDTMCENRAKVGNGTLYTNIFDLEEGLIHLYFFHDFSKKITFNLKEELAKGNHGYNLVDLFPNNQNFQRFINYKTPKNSMTILIVLIASGLLFLFSFVYFFISFLKSVNTNFKNLKLGLSILSLILSVYVFILIRNEGIYYFPSPYNDGHSVIVAISSYIPFLLLVAIIPLLYLMMKIFKQKKWNVFSKCLLVFNNITYCILIGLFFYWKLFDVF